eukprot:1837623-Pleurochrysis_carterae.AAC.1
MPALRASACAYACAPCLCPYASACARVSSETQLVLRSARARASGHLRMFAYSRTVCPCLSVAICARV